MPKPPNSPIRIQIGLRGWSAIAAAIIVLGAVTLLAIGFLVFLLPVLLVAPILYLLMPKQKLNTIHRAVDFNVPTPATDYAETIDGDYTVVNGSAIEERSGPPSVNKS